MFLGGWKEFDGRFHLGNNQVSVGLEIRILMFFILIFLSDSDSHCLNLSSICSVHYEEIHMNLTLNCLPLKTVAIISLFPVCVSD